MTSRKMKLHRLAAMAVLALPCVGHAVTDTEPLSMVYEMAPEPTQRPNGPPVAPQLRVSGACTLSIGQLEDARPGKLYMANATFMLQTVNGTPLFMQSVKGGDPAAWMRTALESTRRYGFQTAATTAGTAPAARQVGVDTSLRLAHAWSAGLNLVSHVVLRANFRTAAGQFSRDYHGIGAKTNWANGNGEFMTVLNLGMESVVADLAADAAALCDGKGLPPQAADL